MFENFKPLFNLAQIGQSRTSITNPLQWTLAILVIAIVLFSLVHVPAIVTTIMLICFAIAFLLFIYAYLFCMHTNPDVLRSENYHLSKMAIERGMLGDSLKGVVENREGERPEPKLIEGEKGDKP